MKRSALLFSLLLSASATFAYATEAPTAPKPPVAPMMQGSTQEHADRFERRIANLPPEKQEELRECRTLMRETMQSGTRRRSSKKPFETLPKAVQEELIAYQKEKRALFEKLSSAARDSFKTHRHSPMRDGGMMGKGMMSEPPAAPTEEKPRQ